MRGPPRCHSWCEIRVVRLRLASHDWRARRSHRFLLIIILQQPSARLNTNVVPVADAPLDAEICRKSTVFLAVQRSKRGVPYSVDVAAPVLARHLGLWMREEGHWPTGQREEFSRRSPNPGEMEARTDSCLADGLMCARATRSSRFVAGFPRRAQTRGLI